MTSTTKLADMLEEVILDFQSVLKKQLEDLSTNSENDSAGIKNRVKEFVDFFKVIQGVELISEGVSQQREQQSQQHIEVVEFRRQLEEQIARLVDAENEKKVPE